MASSLGAQLDALLAQETPFTFEVIVVDNLSTDGSGRLATQYAQQDARVRVLDAAPAGANIARNCGIEAARADVIALCDADDEVLPGWAATLFDACAPRTFVGGRLLPGRNNTASVRRRWATLGPSANDEVWKTDPEAGPVSASCAFYKAMWSDIGGFDARLGRGGDETEFFARALSHGYIYKMAPDAAIKYHLPTTTRAAWQRGVSYGQGALEGGLAAPPRWQLLVKQWTWLFGKLAVVCATGGRGWYRWLHYAGKRAAETTWWARTLLDSK
jgi:glycosyltransferase involved in cell wall biosynthesis